MDGNEKLRQNLMRAVFEVFEKMYYIFLEPVEKEVARKDFSAVEIGFSGDISGRIIARFPHELSMIMAENALGMDDKEISEQILADCRKECLNMLCGNFLQKHDADKLFQMTLPKVVDGKGGSEPDGRIQIQKLDLNFESDQIPLRVEMVIYQQQ
jgi:CheY-specific phosphatase CheX